MFRHAATAEEITNNGNNTNNTPLVQDTNTYYNNCSRKTSDKKCRLRFAGKYQIGESLCSSSCGTHPFSNKKSSLDQLSCFVLYHKCPVLLYACGIKSNSKPSNGALNGTGYIIAVLYVCTKVRLQQYRAHTWYYYCRAGRIPTAYHAGRKYVWRLRYTKFCWIGKHVKYYYETDELPNPWPTQTQEKIG